MIPALIGAGASLLGGLFGSRDKAEDRAAQERMAAQNIALQKEFAQQGIQWKAADARAAGIHPAFAMGAQTSSFSPISIASDPSSPMQSALQSMGQDLSRAVNATRTSGDRDRAFDTSVKRLQLEGAQLDNDIKRATLASSVQRLRANSNPPMPNVLSTGKMDDVTPLMLGNGPIAQDKRYSDTQAATNRYGESADWWHGPMVMWRDYVANNGLPFEPPPGMFRKGSFLDRMFTR